MLHFGTKHHALLWPRLSPQREHAGKIFTSLVPHSRWLLPPPLLLLVFAGSVVCLCEGERERIRLEKARRSDGKQILISSSGGLRRRRRSLLPLTQPPLSSHSSPFAIVIVLLLCRSCSCSRCCCRRLFPLSTVTSSRSHSTASQSRIIFLVPLLSLSGHSARCSVPNTTATQRHSLSAVSLPLSP